MLDFQVTQSNNRIRNRVFLAYKISGEYLMFVQYDLPKSNSTKLTLNYQVIQSFASSSDDDSYEFNECVFHLNSLPMREEGFNKEEAVVMLQNKNPASQADQTIMKLVELDELIANFSSTFTILLD